MEAYICILLFIIRVLFIPLFTPFGTYGFLIHESLSVVLLLLAGKWILSRSEKKAWKPISALVMLAIADLVFLYFAKFGIYGDFPYYPRYVMMSVPLVAGVIISLRKGEGRWQMT